VDTVLALTLPVILMPPGSDTAEPLAEPIWMPSALKFW